MFAPFRTNASSDSHRDSSIGLGALLLGSAIALVSEANADAQMPVKETRQPAAASSSADPVEELVLTAPKLNVRQGAQLVNAEFIDGQITAIKDKSITLSGAEGEQVIPFSSLLHATLSSEPVGNNSDPASLHLHDGTVLRGSSVVFDRGEIMLSVGDDDEQQVAVSRDNRFEHARAIFNRTLPEELSGELQRMVDRVEDDHDRVVVYYPETKTLKAIECFVGALDSKEAVVSLGDESITAPVQSENKQIIGVIFRRDDNDARVADTNITVRTSGGEEIIAQGINTEGDNLKITIADGDIEIIRPLTAVSSLDLSRDKIYDLERLRIKQVATPSPDIIKEMAATGEHVLTPRFNRSLRGAQLTIDGTTFDQGLSIQSGTSISFRLPYDQEASKPSMTTFEATAGIDDSVRSAGDLVLNIYGRVDYENKLLLSKRITAESEPEEIKLNIEGASVLIIEIDPGENLYFGDHLNLGDAKVRR